MDFNGLKKRVLDELKSSLDPSLYYHSYEHTLDVLNAAELISREEGINEYERALLKTASVFHDMGFLKQYDDHEIHSCEFAREYLPNYSFKEDEIDIVCGMIMATKVPQSPHTRLEEIICDADLDYLGREDFWLISDRLYQELVTRGRVTDKQQWNEIQVKFLSNHTYFTNFSREMRENMKQERIKELKATLT